jgi:sugar fermentation stimulation protein sfsA1
MKLTFEQPLIKAKIKERINRFIFTVELNGQEVEAHCPSGGTIAGISRKDFKDIECLLSDRGTDTGRRTRYTVEAISLDDGLTYAGINQTKSNRYVEYFLQDDTVKNILQVKDEVKREKKLGNSRIDFKAGDCYIEVKTMVADYYCKASPRLTALMKEQQPSVERIQKHVRTLTNEIKANNSRAAIITVFQYDAPTFEPPVDEPVYAEFVEDLKLAKAAGLRQFQMNIRITETYAELISFKENEVI